MFLVFLSLLTVLWKLYSLALVAGHWIWWVLCELRCWLLSLLSPLFASLYLNYVDDLFAVLLADNFEVGALALLRAHSLRPLFLPLLPPGRLLRAEPRDLRFNPCMLLAVLLSLRSKKSAACSAVSSAK